MTKFINGSHALLCHLPKLAGMILLFILSLASFAQDPSFGAIDQRVATLDAPTPDSLGRLLAAPYQSERAKVRAVYSWIAQHIGYNTFVLKGARRNGAFFPLIAEDSMMRTRTPDQITAEKVMRRRIAVCEGYAKLFHVLCSAASLESSIITGFARGYEEGGARFRTNHTWNAVKIDGKWELVDVTWGSGYVNFGNSFVQRLDEKYFLSPPEVFAEDHLPEDPRWTLLSEQPTISEFRKAPFRYKSYVKYRVQGFSPQEGVITAIEGDTLMLEIRVDNAVKDTTIAPDPFFDSSLLQLSGHAFIGPLQKKANRMIYHFVVRREQQWLNLLYNGDLMLRYRLRVQARTGQTISTIPQESDERRPPSF